MIKHRFMIEEIPAICWGEPSDRVYLYVHGKNGFKEEAERFAAWAAKAGFQTLSFDLPAHGERRGKEKTCDVWNAPQDVICAADYAFSHWKKVSLFGSSLGAYFCLLSFQQRPFENALFRSPIIDMEFLIHKMMGWFGVTEEQLKEQGEIPTPIETLSWDYLTYVREHPVTVWDTPTAILYGAKDEMQDLSCICRFGEVHGCSVTVSMESEHAFMEPSDEPIISMWIEKNI